MACHLQVRFYSFQFLCSELADEMQEVCAVPVQLPVRYSDSVCNAKWTTLEYRRPCSGDRSCNMSSCPARLHANLLCCVPVHIKSIRHLCSCTKCWGTC